MARITIATAGHLATCPRLVKAADALAAAGHRVRVVSASHTDWAAAADRDLLERRRGAWASRVVDHWRGSGAVRRRAAGARMRVALGLARVIGPGRVPLPLAVRAWTRMHRALGRAVLAEPADLIYGGTTGALAAAAWAAGRAGVPYGLDLEDFHGGEGPDTPEGRLLNRLAERVERAALPGATFLTTSSEAIAQAYGARYGLHPLVIHNVFPLPARAPLIPPAAGEGLRLYWLGQTIGPGRGLEHAVHAMGAAGIPGELHLRGREVPGYTEGLLRLAERAAPRLKLFQHAPAPPDRMVELAEGFDVGLGLEPVSSENNGLVLSNKLCTYMLGGLALALTDTPGQRPLVRALGEHAIGCAPGDVAGLAAGLRLWMEDRGRLLRARAAAWEAARRRWHWEHPEERGVLLAAVSRALGG